MIVHPAVKTRYVDYLILPPPKPSIQRIQDAVTKYYGLSPDDMVSERRMRSVAYPRQLAMYLCRHLTPRSLPQIGRAFGGRDHSTVLHAIRQVEWRIEHDPDIAEAERDIRLALGVI